MTNLNDVLSTPVMQTLGSVLLHFLWQGTLIALVFAGLLFTLRSSSSTLRYKLSCLALVLMLLAPIATFMYLTPSAKPVYNFVDKPEQTILSQQTQQVSTPERTETTAPQQAVIPEVKETKVYKPSIRFSFKGYLPWLVALWLIGVLILSVRLLGGLWLTHQLRTKGIKPVSLVLESRLQDLAKKLELFRTVRLYESALVNVPAVIGWLKPVILLPASTLSGLSMEQLELILAHELAHIRRSDYLVNILQKVAETLLFYHPAIWWVSGVIRQEREHCCDDLAMQICQSDKLNYARTLAQLEGLRPASQVVLAANGGSLLKRIQRLAGKPTVINNPAQWIAGIILVLIPVIIFSVATAQAKLPAQIEENIDAFVMNRLEAWNVPGLQVAVIKDGQVTFNKAYGMADRESQLGMTTKTPIQIGEGTFFMEFLAALQLIDKGKLDPNDLIIKYLPWIQFKNDEENTITVKQLLEGSANIVDTVHVPRLRFYSNNITNIINPEITNAEDYFRSLMPNGLYTQAGYSFQDNITFFNNDLLLSLVIEKASGLSFRDYVKQNIFAPLGMDATYDIREAQANGLAKTYTWVGGVPRPRADNSFEPQTFAPPLALDPILGLFMSSEDITKLLIGMLDKNSGMFSEKTWESIWLDESEDNNLGSWSLWNILENRIFGAIGGTTSSSMFFEYIPSTNTGYVTLANYNIPEYNHPLYEVLGSISLSLFMLDDEVYFTPSEYLSELLPNPSPIAIENLRGTYISAIGPIELFAKDDELHGTVLGHGFKLESVAFAYLIRSDFEKINGLMLRGDNQTLSLAERQFAFRVK